MFLLIYLMNYVNSSFILLCGLKFLIILILLFIYYHSNNHKVQVLCFDILFFFLSHHHVHVFLALSTFSRTDIILHQFQHLQQRGKSLLFPGYLGIKLMILYLLSSLGVHESYPHQKMLLSVFKSHFSVITFFL